MALKQVPTGDPTLAERVRERRQVLELSQGALAQRVSSHLADDQSVGQTFISQIEHSRIWTSPDKLRALAAALETSLAYLLGEAVAPERPRPRPLSLGIGDSAHTDTARRAGEERPDPPAWR